MKTKNKITVFFRILFGLLFFIILTVPAQAQIPFPGGDPNVPDVPAAPINGLVGLALMVGVYLGIKNFWRNNS